MARGFKVGDKIRVYFNEHCVRTGFVTEINGELLKYSMRLGENWTAWTKQCRKLVKKTPRRVWVLQHSNGQLSPDHYLLYPPPEGCAPSEGDSFIEFIEVRKRVKP